MNNFILQKGIVLQISLENTDLDQLVYDENNEHKKPLKKISF